MTQQLNYTDLEYSNRKRLTKREQFLDCMDEITPWDEIVEMIRPYSLKNKVGRPAREIEILKITWAHISKDFPLCLFKKNNVLILISFDREIYFC